MSFICGRSSERRVSVSDIELGRNGMRNGGGEDVDPLTLALQPPPGETPAQKETRERLEAEAKRISDEIDEQLKAEERAAKRKKRPVKVMLLGQSESGKSATLKNFQLTYARREWLEERSSWRSVIQLNLIRNVNEILEMLTREMSNSSSIPLETTISDEDEEGPSSARFSTRSGPKLRFTEKHRLLKSSLAPLARVEQELQYRLGSAATEIWSTSVTNAAPFDLPAKKPGGKEFGIRSNNGWKTALDKFRTAAVPGASDAEPEYVQKLRESDSKTSDTIASCKDDMKSLWEDPVINEMLARRKFRIEDSSGFFLNDLERIATREYAPTDEDVVRSRLRTLGVQEYKMTFDHGPAVGQEWWLYDVGGTRSSRAAWYSYFDDLDAAIFIVPVSGVDEKLAEDKRVNRLEDSYLLWRSVCSCKLLSRTQMILFLNKCDLLQAKLMRGVRIRDQVPSYSDRKNDLPTATRYFQQHFKEILKQFSPVQRPFFVHLTSVIDTKSTAVTLGAVEESILRDHLRRADLM